MNLREIEQYCRLLQSQPFVGTLEIEGAGARLRVSRARYLPATALDAPSAPEEPAEAARFVVRADRVGTFRSAESPIGAGGTLAAGEIVGYIDSMRILNPLASEVAGEVEAVLVEDGDPVEFGQEILRLLPAVDGGAQQ